MFSTLPKTDFNFSITFILSSANAVIFDQSKILSLSKELNVDASKHLHFFLGGGWGGGGGVATIVLLSLSYIYVHISIVTEVEKDHIEPFLKIFYGVILALSCNKRTPPSPSHLSVPIKIINIFFFQMTD